ncbi:P-loop containing nucleoside triphosphate hydrolase protein, partial [Hysterangium stoloniferum]
MQADNHIVGHEDRGLGIKVLVEGTTPTVEYVSQPNILYLYIHYIYLSVVAIHGLDGHRERTWTAENDTLWLRDLLPHKLPHARIIVYGYDACTEVGPLGTRQTLFDHGENFIVRLALERAATSTTTRPIIFIAHSLGGIILKCALIHANQCHATHLAHHRQILQSTHGILFIGTPHQGAEIALSASRLLKILPLNGNTTHPLLKHLESNSEMLSIQLSLSNGISTGLFTKFLYEEYPTVLHNGTSEMIVPKSSAVVPGTTNAESIGLHKSHNEMVKFGCHGDEDFNTVATMLYIIHTGSMSLFVIKTTHLNNSMVDAENGGLSYKRKLLSSPRFTGQDSYLDQLSKFFTFDEVTISPKHLLLFGMGGIGKTQICLRFAEQCDNNKIYWRIFWLDATTKETLETSFSNIAKTDSAAKLLGIEKTGDDVLAWLSEQGSRCLLIFDNADGMTDEVTHYLPMAHNMDLLITSRNPELRQFVTRAIDVQVMTEEDALMLLRKAAEKEEDTTSLTYGLLQGIAKILGLLPLALDVAGAAIRTGLCTVADYSAIYSKNQPAILGGVHRSYRGASQYDQTVFGALNISYDQIEHKCYEATQDALFILKMLGFFHHQNITEKIFQQAAE